MLACHSIHNNKLTPVEEVIGNSCREMSLFPTGFAFGFFRETELNLVITTLYTSLAMIQDVLECALCHLPIAIDTHTAPAGATHTMSPFFRLCFPCLLYTRLPEPSSSLRSALMQAPCTLPVLKIPCFVHVLHQVAGGAVVSQVSTVFF